MGQLRTMGIEGDKRLSWDPAKPEEVEKAQKEFDRLKAKGYLAYKVVRTEARGEQLTKFDPAAEKIIMAPPMQGG